MNDTNKGNRDVQNIMKLASDENKSNRTSAKENSAKSKDIKPVYDKSNTFLKIVSFFVPMKGDGKPEIIRKVVLDVSIIAFIILGCVLISPILTENVQADVVDKQIESMYKEEPVVTTSITTLVATTTVPAEDEDAEPAETTVYEKEPSIQESFAELYETNNDIVGWIRVGSTDDPVINYQVVQAEDNDYYLTHNFLKEEVKRGAIFADFRNNFDKGSLSGNTVLYGHNMWQGDTMFAKLSRYYDGGVSKGESNDYLSFYKEHPTVTFNTLYENAEWKVFACVLFNTQEEKGEVYPYNHILDFANADEFNNFVIDIMDRSVLWTDVDLTYGDSILTLSTCYYPFGKTNADTRVAVFARKVRPGESTEVDVSKASRNPNPLKFEYQYQVEGGSWDGSVWDKSHLLSFEE